MVAQNGPKQNYCRRVDLKFASSEAALRKRYRERVIFEQERQRLATVIQIEDGNLIDRLMEAGFTSDNVAALTLVPVAAAAWGSGYVTGEEQIAAIRAIFSFNVADSSIAEECFRGWLEERPSEELMKLWKEYTFERLQNATKKEREGCGRHLLGLAESVALASGGFAGIGQICSGERDVLETVRRVYRLPE